MGQSQISLNWILMMLLTQSSLTSAITALIQLNVFGSAELPRTRDCHFLPLPAFRQYCLEHCLNKTYPGVNCLFLQGIMGGSSQNPHLKVDKQTAEHFSSQSNNESHLQTQYLIARFYFCMHSTKVLNTWENHLAVPYKYTTENTLQTKSSSSAFSCNFINSFK